MCLMQVISERWTWGWILGFLRSSMLLFPGLAKTSHLLQMWSPRDISGSRRQVERNLFTVVDCYCCPGHFYNPIMGPLSNSTKSLLWTEMCPTTINSYVEAPTSSVMVFGDGAFGRELGLAEVMGWGPHDGISVLVKRDTRKLSLLLSVM